MRVTSTSIQNMVGNISSQQSQLYELYNKINSGQKYTNISDNPIDAADIVRLNKQLSEIGAYSRNVQNATTQINAQDEAFSTIVDKLQRINDLAIQAANSASGEDGFKACKAEIEELKKTIVNLANTQYDGKYIFAGTNVTTKPFELADDGTITYHGTPANNTAGYERYLEISDGVKVELNSSGDSIFGTYDPNDPNKSSGLFKVLGDLEAALNTDPMDNDAVREQLDPLQNSIKHISEIQSVHSSTVTKLTMTTEMLDSTEINLKSKLAAISEVDLPSAITELVQQNYSLQASMQAYTIISNQSLLDYI
ncbi:MAG: flagellar hook-associated protein FlgL [Candidatus Gastranaerophilaceae bacterium]|jgi:flagellar hook-associated protein 3 FlgL